MGFTASDVITFPDDGIVVHNDGTYHRIRSGIAKPVSGQLDTAGNIFFVFCHDGSYLIPIFASVN
jgi:hypothetical protein